MILPIQLSDFHKNYLQKLNLYLHHLDSGVVSGEWKCLRKVSKAEFISRYDENYETLESMGYVPTNQDFWDKLHDLLNNKDEIKEVELPLLDINISN